MHDIREIHGEPDLATDPGTRNILASEQTETEGQAVADRVLASGHRLKLPSPQIPAVGVRAVNLASQR